MADNQEAFVEPSGTEFAGTTRFVVPESPYDSFIRDEAVPVHRGIGVHDCRDVELGDWARTGGRGAYIQLAGLENMWGMYLVQVPAGQALNVERHLYEEIHYVIEGRGTTRIWSPTGEETFFEWQAGSLFAIPLNVKHQIVNATNSPALLLGATTSAPVINLFGSGPFVFDNPTDFTDRFAGGQGYFDYQDEILPDPITSRAMQLTSFIPDIVRSELPLDNQRSPGYRRVEPHMAGGRQYLWIGEHATGRYSRAHYHEAGAVLFCLKGQGYSYTWPRDLGTRPWAEGHGDRVLRQDYVAGGMVAAAPGGGDWFHQHFGVSSEPLRLLRLGGTYNPFTRGVPGVETALANASLKDGGHTIDYFDEDPFVRAEFERSLERAGAVSTMPEDLYT
jgi:mannose-6-phosphate isomerase-like protein (cupin superfamily)